jgi:hypothetical protein
MQHDQLIHRGLLEQRLDRLQRHIHQLSDEVASVDAIKATASLSSASAVRELEHSLRAEIHRLQHELDACEAQLRWSRDQISENQQPSEQ